MICCRLLKNLTTETLFFNAFSIFTAFDRVPWREFSLAKFMANNTIISFITRAFLPFFPSFLLSLFLFFNFNFQFMYTRGSYTRGIQRLLFERRNFNLDRPTANNRYYIFRLFNFSIVGSSRYSERRKTCNVTDVSLDLEISRFLPIP